MVATSSVAMILPAEILHGLEGGRLGNSQHPADLAETLLGVDEVGDGDHVGLILFDPVAAGETGVKDAVFHVARHLLGANEHALDFGVVDAGK